MSRGVWWTAEEDATLLRLRDVARLGWKEIAERMPGRSTASCEQRYYNKLKAKRDRTPRPTGPAPKGKTRGFWRRPVCINVPLALAPPPAPAAPPVIERRRMPSLDHLRDRAELLARIDSQGLTAGFFGDPAPGRSALDQRVSAAAAVPELPYKRGGLDGY